MPKLDWKPGGSPDHPVIGNGNNVNLPFYLNHYYPHNSKQILEYIFSLNKYMESWDEVLINQLTLAGNFATVNNLTIIFYTVLTKIWFSVIMIQAITYMAYWFTVAKTGQRKPFHQICICSKTMQRVSLELSHCLFMVFMERRVLNPFIKYSGDSKEHTAQCNQLR